MAPVHSRHQATLVPGSPAPTASPPSGPRDHLFREDCWEPSSTGPLPGLTGGTQNFLEGWKCVLVGVLVVWVHTLAKARPRDRGGVV